uniref:Vacuolar ATPase assembly protein VMA22 n=1 Tax=Branchiostoma floridae TaxID=7739 RepID=C3ZAH7_BRAFL|eukprot:XP_002594369.1 hypothetical protein BRAFLDRAFT_208951 [Branchiostoma floridae]
MYLSLLFQGYFNLAKARYSLGVKGVGQIQYAAIMEPLVHVHEQREGSDEEEDDEVAELSSGVEDLELHQVVDPHSLQDPLRWFGILVPPCLRHGQHSFSQGMPFPSPICHVFT